MPPTLMTHAVVLASLTGQLTDWIAHREASNPHVARLRASA